MQVEIACLYFHHKERSLSRTYIAGQDKAINSRPRQKTPRASLQICLPVLDQPTACGVSEFAHDVLALLALCTCSLPVSINSHCHAAAVWYATPDFVAMPACLWPETVAAAAKTGLCVVCMQSLSVFTLPMRQDLPAIGLFVVVLHC